MPPYFKISLDTLQYVFETNSLIVYASIKHELYNSYQDIELIKLALGNTCKLLTVFGNNYDSEVWGVGVF